MNKVAWVIPSLNTGIGKYTKIVKEYLEKFLNFYIFNAEEKFDSEVLSDFSTIVYNFGNTYQSLLLYSAIRKYPGIVILHDRTYQHFFAYYYLEYLKRPDLYYKALSYIYGDYVAQYAETQNKSGVLIWETEDCIKYPMRELIYPYATAVIVHSKNYLEMVSEEYNGISIYLPVPFKMYDAGLDKKFDRKKLNLPDKKIILLSYGFMSKNRIIGVEEILKLIGENEEIRRNVFYVIAGNVNDKYLDEINSIVKYYGLDENVRILCGYISDDELCQYLTVSDMCINLRIYNTEGMSWSVLEQMSSGKVVLAFNKGFFSELPDNTLIKLENIDQLKEKFLKIIFNPSILKNFGENAKRYVLEQFNPDFFMRSFLSFIEKFSLEINKKKVLKGLSRDLINLIPAMPDAIEDRLLSAISKDFCEVFLEEKES